MDGLKVSFDPKSGARASLKVSHNLLNMKVTKTLTLQGSIDQSAFPINDQIFSKFYTNSAFIILFMKWTYKIHK